MTIDLLPGHGVRLPAPLPELCFGLTQEAVRDLLELHHALLPGGVRPTFVCGSPWSLCFELPGVSVTLTSDGGDGGGDGDGDSNGLQGVTIGRNPSDDRPACPVGYRGIDLLGWPAHELVEALRAQGLAVPDPDAGGSLRIGPLHLSRRPHRRPSRSSPGRKPRHQPPFHFDYVSLHGATRERRRGAASWPDA
ncbi:hypothetical protein ACGF07_23590 [Kitasatospora sp. NPDC048194]|uniref:hypothetical protein n=1 Tax=Kitasatospora sp. NPDC048194 TaxID=3364045 RepID=UPI00371003FD